MEHSFTLKYQLPPETGAIDALVERFAQEGCDDALVGGGQQGYLALQFIREAATAREAIESAMEDIRRASPHALLIEISPELQGLVASDSP
ncbi:hypothetical protein [Pseudomonas serbica]|uniref:hypothetical protein n=1 Tax=Pseudomonas serbica TaxID=2965074 RepID=UPI00237A6081|nr:hypothetical protein [Pseudomonas serbica]